MGALVELGKCAQAREEPVCLGYDARGDRALFSIAWIDGAWPALD